ncbi:MAG: alpha-amylase [Anaerolineae bacterium]|nr:MAG: alpha-amylase [Anaerolineae bacterium]
MSYRDNIFGNLFEPETRLSLYQATRLGVRHLNRRNPLLCQPEQPTELTVTTSGPEPFERVSCWFQTEAGHESTFDLTPGTVEWDNTLGDYIRTWHGILPPQPNNTMLRYRVGAQMGRTQTWVYADNQTTQAEQATQFACWVTEAKPPDWSRHAIVYHIFVDRFYPGDGKPWKTPDTLSGFYGGTLRGITQKLDYIQNLGFNVIWLSPIFPSPSHHGYDATDYFSIEPRLGTLEDFQELLREAHTRQMRVLLDFVANHCSNQHPAFLAAQTDSHSPMCDWFTWQDWPKEYATYFGVREMPEFNLRRAPARQYLLESARFWLEMGVDGFRLDYAYGPSHDFWAEFQRTCRQTRPDCWTFGEIIHTPETQRSYSGTMDGALDFLLCRALRETFGHRNWSPARFEAFLSQHEVFFPAWFSQPAFLDNHDMNRFLFIAQEDPAKLKLAALALFTLAGPPIVYYGTEVGVTQERPIHQNSFGIFEEARLPMKWGSEQNTDLRETFRQLIALRRAYPFLATAPRRLLHLDEQTLAYARQSADGLVIAAFNLAPTSRRMFLPGISLMHDALHNGRTWAEQQGLWLELPAQSGAFLV